MKIHQLSMFLENKPGHLSGACDALAESGINIITMSLADTQQFGILRLIVRDWQAGKAALEAAGYVVNVTPVLATEVPDQPGGLAKVLKIIDAADVNIEYVYAYTYRNADQAVLLFRFDDPDAAAGVLADHGVTVLSPETLFQRAGE